MGKIKIEKFRENLLTLKKIGVDSMVFIYQFTDDPYYALLTNVIFELLETQRISVVTSTITLIEVFVQPEKEKNSFIITEYEKIFQHLPNLKITSLDWYLARLTSKLRAKYQKIKIPDAIQISSALINQCAGFITNDTQLKQVKEIKVLVLKDYL